MDIALLFSSIELPSNYGYAARKLVLRTSVLKQSSRRMIVLHGDVRILAYARTNKEFDELADATYFAPGVNLLNRERIRASYRRDTIYAIVVENASEQISKDLHVALQSQRSYLGLHAIDFSYGKHRVFYKMSLLDYGEINGSRCALYFHTDRDPCESDLVLACGFSTVRWKRKLD